MVGTRRRPRGHGFLFRNRAGSSSQVDAALEDTVSRSGSRAGHPWTTLEERRLYDATIAGETLQVIACAHGRTRGGIRSRLRKLGMFDLWGEPVHPWPAFSATARRIRVRSRCGGKACCSLTAEEDMVFALLRRLAPSARVTALTVMRGLILLEGRGEGSVSARQDI